MIAQSLFGSIAVTDSVVGTETNFEFNLISLGYKVQSGDVLTIYLPDYLDGRFITGEPEPECYVDSVTVTSCSIESELQAKITFGSNMVTDQING